MYLTLALVVLCAAIIVLFSQEFIRTFKNIFKIKGMILILPLAIASWLVYNFDYWVLWVLYYYREVLNAIISFLSGIMPFQQGASSIIAILLLTGLSVIPVFLLEWFLWKKHYKRYQYPYLTSTLIWIVSSILLLVLS